MWNVGPFHSLWPSLAALSQCSSPSSGRPEHRGIWGVDMVKLGPLGFAGPVMRSCENTWGDSAQSWAPLSKWHPHGDPRPQGINLWWERKRSNGHIPRCPQALGRYHGVGDSWVCQLGPSESDAPLGRGSCLWLVALQITQFFRK